MSHATPAAPRRALHLRRISSEAFEREDGLIDIEAVLTDTRPVRTSLVTGRDIEAGQPIHRMRMRLTIDRERRIVDAQAFSEAHPYRECEAVESAYAQLIGLRIEPGFTQAVKRLFRGEAGCTHLTELLPTMATTAFQVLWADLDATGPGAAAGGTPVGGCHGLRADGEVVRLHLPQFAKGGQS